MRTAAGTAFFFFKRVKFNCIINQDGRRFSTSSHCTKVKPVDSGEGTVGMDGPPSAAAQLPAIYWLFPALINRCNLISRGQSRHFGVSFGKFMSCPSRYTRFSKEQPPSYPISVKFKIILNIVCRRFRTPKVKTIPNKSP